jgi:hypothetical protein
MKYNTHVDVWAIKVSCSIRWKYLSNQHIKIPSNECKTNWFELFMQFQI